LLTEPAIRPTCMLA